MRKLDHFQSRRIVVAGQDSEMRAGAGDVENLAVFLQQYGVDFWSEKLEHCATRLRKGDYYGGVGLRELFGGMGSLNDLVICAVNGHSVASVEEDQMNSELERLLSNVREFTSRFK